jgi:DNA-binding transcriptional regulator YhcF (GntR family)
LGDSGIKAAERIARELEQQIFASQWQAGHFLGREDDLAREIGASRAIFREAIAIVEQEGLVECRRGQRGGLFVGAAARETRTAMVRNYLVLGSATPNEVHGRRAWLERMLCVAATEKLDPRECQPLRDLFRLPEDRSTASIVRHNSATLRKLLDLADLPALEIFCMAVIQANIEITVWHGATESDLGVFAGRAARLRCDLVEAVIGLDMHGIAQIQDAITGLYRGMGLRFPEPPRDLETATQRLTMLWTKFPAHDARRAKKPQVVARLIASRMAARGSRSWMNSPPSLPRRDRTMP